MSQRDRPPEPTGRMRYYALVDVDRPRSRPGGLVRRQPTVEGNIDEHLTRKLTWETSSAIIEWEHGEVGEDLFEITEDEAAALIERWRVKWQAEDQR